MTEQLFKVTIAVALLANGWGYALAAYLCPHGDCMTKVVAERPSERAEMQGASEHGCHDGMGQSEKKQDDYEAEEKLGPDTREALVGIPKHLSSCGHCVGAPQAPTRSTSQVSISKARDAVNDNVLRPRVTITLRGVVAFPAIMPSMGAPPGISQPRKHLLISTFLI